MTLPLLAIIVIAALGLGYTFYGRFIAKQYKLDDTVVTPAHTQRDDVDFVPTRPFYLMGQHFSAIAAAGPVVGPIVACMTFGWLPCVLWIVFGVIFIGAVHDFSALIASVRHGARSVAEIVKQNVGKRAWLAIMAFIWIALLYVIVAFVDVTASTFVGQTQELEGTPYNKSGAVAMAAVLYLALALVLGLVQRKWKPPLWLVTIIFVPAALGMVWLGTELSTVLTLPQKSWGFIILGYCFVSSLLPVWLLLQPRGYLGGFILYFALAIGVVGIFFGGHEIQQPAFTSMSTGGLTGQLLPFLFVTIACGACSGFHGLVCSGTTSKQISKESHCHPIGYGAMLLEGFVAIIALATAVIVPLSASPRGPGVVYGDGIGLFLASVTDPAVLTFAVTFGAMAFSTFVFDTLDVATRLGRYILQELFGSQGKVAGIMATLATVGLPAVFIATASTPGPGERPTYMKFWTLFGTSNQLLAALTLLGVTVWLRKSGKRAWFTIAPMLFVMTITVWALILQIAEAFQVTLSFSTESANGIAALALCLLALLLIVESARALLQAKAPTAPSATA